ncbi:MAG: hypothetical protein ABI990_11085 [Actinomycetota bacterium]
MSDVEALAAQLAEAEQERDRAAAEAEAFAETIEEKLREIDGGHALNEISEKHADKARGDVLAERDSLQDNADRARRAADYVRTRLEEAAEAAAEALRAEPVADYQVAEQARQKAAAVLAERERDVAEAEAKLDQAYTAAEDLRCDYIASARSERAARESRKQELILWAVRSQNPLSLEQLPEEIRAEARAEIDRLAAESRERREAYEAAQGWEQLEA